MLETIVIIIIALYLLAFMCCRLYAGYRKPRDGKKIQRLHEKSEGVHSQISQADKKQAPLKKTLSNIRNWAEPYFYGLTRYMSIHIGRIPSHRIRKFLLRHIFLMEIHPDAIIYGGFEIRSPWNIKLGRVVVGVGCLLDGRNGIIMEDDVCLAQNVMIFTEQHDLNDPLFRCNNKGGTVYIGKHAWISSRTTLLPRVKVGEGAVLACGAVATKDLAPFGVYGGIPAKKISDRSQDLQYELGCKNKPFWHFY